MLAFILTLGLALIVASALGRAAAENYWMLLAAVMVFGIGGPVVSSGAPKIVTSTFAGSQRGLAMGIYMTGPTLGGILSLTLTHSVLLPWFDQDWRWVMVLWGGFAGAAMVVWLAIASFAGKRVPGFHQAAPDTSVPHPNSLAVIGTSVPFLFWGAFAFLALAVFTRLPRSRRHAPS